MEFETNYYAIFISLENGDMKLKTVQDNEMNPIVRFVENIIEKNSNKRTKRYYEKYHSVSSYLRYLKSKPRVFILSDDEMFPMIIFGKKESGNYTMRNWDNIIQGNYKNTTRLKKRVPGKDPVERLKRRAMSLLREKKEDDLMFGYRGGYTKKEIDDYLSGFYYFNLSKVKSLKTRDEILIWAKGIDEEYGESFEKNLLG